MTDSSDKVQWLIYIMRECRLKNTLNRTFQYTKLSKQMSVFSELRLIVDFVKPLGRGRRLIFYFVQKYEIQIVCYRNNNNLLRYFCTWQND